MRLVKTAAFVAACVLAGGAASATSLRITVENLAAPNGLAITPVFAAFHNGNFDAFSQGGAVTAGVESVAEVGDSSGVAGELTAADPNAVSVNIAAAGNGVPPIEPGEIGQAILQVLNPSSQRFLSILAMIIPSNDTFIGNDDPTAFEIFDGTGAFNGPFSIDITGLFIYDAGSEVNDPTDGAAFVAGVNGALGTSEGGVVTQGLFDLADFAGITTATGGTLDGSLIDFAADPAGFLVARVTVEAVPLPAALPLMLGGLAVFGVVASKRRKSAVVA